MTFPRSPSSSDAAAAFATLFDRVLESPELVGKVADESGATYRIERRPPPGAVLTMTHLEPRRPRGLDVSVFEVDDDRPADYPGSLPMMPRNRVIIMKAIDGSQRQVTWTNLSDPSRAADEVIQQCLDDGWEPAETTGPFSMFRRGEATRAFLHGPPLFAGKLQMLEFSGS